MKEEKRVEKEQSDLRREAEARLQTELAEKQFEMQQKLIQLQVSMHETVSKEQKVDRDLMKMVDRAVQSISPWKSGEDLELFLLTAESKLRLGKVKEEDWIHHISSKLHGTTAQVWQDAACLEEDYLMVKQKVLKACGHTPKLAAEAFYSFRSEQAQGLTGDQLYNKGCQLYRRMVAEATDPKEVEFLTLRGWIYSVVPKQARRLLDVKGCQSKEELLDGLQDYLLEEGARSTGLAAIFKKSAEGGKERTAGSFNCFTCGKPGHRAAECRGVKMTPVSTGSVVPISNEEGKIVCFYCKEDGHKSNVCPKKLKDKNSKAKPVRRQAGGKHDTDVRLSAAVDDQDAVLLLDSGATVSIVPKSMVHEDRWTGGSVTIVPYHGGDSRILPTARVSFRAGTLEWDEVVAVDPDIDDNQVLFSLDLKSARGLQLVLDANQVDQADIRRVLTRANVKALEAEEKEELEVLEVELPRVTPIQLPVATSLADVNGMNNVKDVEFDFQALGGVDEVLIDSDEVLIDSDEVLSIPIVKEGGAGRAELCKATVSDDSLAEWRKCADLNEKGFSWKEGLLLQSITSHEWGSLQLIVLPKDFRSKVLTLAHEKLGHLGARKVKSIIRRNFSWPGMGRDIIDHCKSCDQCQRGSKRQAGKAPMVQRQVMAEPFESMAFDLVGPIDKKCKGGYRFLLTAVDMASRWPEAIPLKGVTARAVAQGMVQIFSRTGIPLELLSDQGPQFVGSLVTHLCKDLHIDQMKTTPYHPQTNGVVERMHGTLGAMLTKASSAGLDWVEQVPFALFALRAAPNRDSGFSPFELVFGHTVRTPLDILYQGWSVDTFHKFDALEWSEWLSDKLEVWHELQEERNQIAGGARKEYYDKKAVVRTLEPGDQVLYRVPGLIRKLEESWKGPFTVLDRVSTVDYRIDIGRSRKKVIHINNLKKYLVRPESVKRVAVIAEDCSEDEVIGVKLRNEAEDFDKSVVTRLLEEFPEVFLDSPGQTDVCTLKIVTGSETPIASHPYRIPDKLNP